MPRVRVTPTARPAEPLLWRTLEPGRPDSALEAEAGGGVSYIVVSIVGRGFLAWMIYRSRLPGVGAIEYVLMFPQAVPRLVFAFGMLWAWLIFPIPVYGTLWLLLIAYLTVFLPLGLRTISGVILQIDRSLEESAQMCGASWSYRLRTVTMPLLRPGLIAAWNSVSGRMAGPNTCVKRVSGNGSRSAACVSAGRTAASRSAAMRCAVSSCDRGESATVVELRLPPPHAAWVS